MKWYHFSVEYFEDLRNVNHCEFLIMRKKEDSGKYILENNLRTWSELKRERAAAIKEKEKEKQEKSEKLEKPADAVSPTLSPVPKRKQWGGCPNGCDHGKHYYKKENSMHAMQLNGRELVEGLAFRRPAARRWQSSSEEDEDDPRGRLGPKVDVQKSLDEVVSSPDGTPSFISIEDRLRTRVKSPNHFSLLHAGRDFGGSASGHTSQAGSDTEASAEEDSRRLAFKKKSSKISLSTSQDNYVEESGMGRGAMADALGDQSDVGSDGEQDLDKAEKKDKSFRGSVL
jgi:hypothetical protein